MATIALTDRAKSELTHLRRAAIFADAAEIIEREHADPIDVDLLARRVAASRRQLQRAFAEVGGTTVTRYLTETRMTKAAELLRQGEHAVAQVGRAVGYRHAAHFARAFRRHFGMSPSEFAARWRRT